MASDLSKYFGNKIVRWIAGQAMPTAPTNVYLALFNGDPKASGSEVTTTVRVAGRVSVAWTIPASNDTDNLLVNSAAADFGAANADTTITHTAIFDSSAGGKMLASKALPGGSVAVVATQPVSFGAGDVKFNIGS